MIQEIEISSLHLNLRLYFFLNLNILLKILTVTSVLMNKTENCSEDLGLILDLNQASYVIAYYVMTPVSGFGFILNLLTVILLARSKLSRLNTTFYDSFFCKCFCDIVVCLLFSMNANFACNCNFLNASGSQWSSNSSYEYILFISFIEYPGIRISLLASAYSEIALILNR